MRERLVKELPTFDIARFDMLEDYALALAFAQSKYLFATQPPDDLALMKQARAFRVGARGNKTGAAGIVASCAAAERLGEDIRSVYDGAIGDVALRHHRSGSAARLVESG